MLKKIAALLICALLPVAAAAESVAVNAGTAAALIDDGGAEIIAPGVFDYIFPLSEDGGTDLFCAGGYVGGAFAYALVGADGALLTDQIYDMFTYEDGAVLFMRGGLYGMMNARGEVLIPAEYTQLVPNGAGGFLALTTDCYDDEPDGLYHIDEHFAVSATGVMTLGELGWFSEGLLALLSAENGMFGYVDTAGRWAIRPQLAYGGMFQNGRAIASLSTGYGLIDPTGNWVLTPKYDTLSCEDSALAIATLGSDTAVALDPQTGRELFRATGENLYAVAYADKMQVYDDASSRLYDATGALIHESSPLTSYFAAENGRTIMVDGDWGSESCYLLDADGSVAAGPYQDIFSLGGGARYGFARFDSARVYDAALGHEIYESDMATMRYGIIDEHGAEVLPAAYQELYRIGEDRLFARLDGVDGVIDFNGNWIYRFENSGE